MLWMASILVHNVPTKTNNSWLLLLLLLLWFPLFFTRSVAVVVSLLADCESYIVFRLLYNWLMPFSTSFSVLVRLLIRAQQQAHAKTVLMTGKWLLEMSPARGNGLVYFSFDFPSNCMTNQIKWNLTFFFSDKTQYETKKRIVYKMVDAHYARAPIERFPFSWTLRIHLNRY